MNIVQKSALELIQSDAIFISYLVKASTLINNNYISMSMPYIGLFADGAEKWGKAMKIGSPTFNKLERDYYLQMRLCHKIFELNYNDLYEKLKKNLKISDLYFSELCHPIAKKLKLYNNYGVDLYEDKVCGNTILCYMYNPLADKYFNIDGEKIKELSIVVGKLCSFYGGDIASDNLINKSINSKVKDYHFNPRTPLKNKSFDQFVLFSILCTINYLIYFIDRFVIKEFPYKLRFAYLQYYYLVELISQINNKLNTTITVDNSWVSREFRNCMAHYGLMQTMKKSDIIEDDLLKGISIKIFKKDYYEFKEIIYNELERLSLQLEELIF
ncbi:hypothetical protein L0P54_08250 [Anaerosalibacter bizertensis]|uniref:Uncharacterized protein n=1 Tax=Anaerosalibacter bizertensis TaxID=932217 RepID=A0A9Q4ADF9_9FIRM|nr:hypothetical protein [Anaerosalibacter bizertensis]MBV1820158.1 hypothetical protein [Bacteroidales bacterium MSK.15.36]MCB5559216.1 hypothetical protein [Anaerosalibacter bizertensis]MCG4565379.1 hypothetical protein [Anaerosalibacter bizertensis]MCG4582978.1 hypothetical protein [Anaerosalibacter bizertensis]MCG4584074.1 hypothetical protein [Anaerosalibacter bizertensis]